MAEGSKQKGKVRQVSLNCMRTCLKNKQTKTKQGQQDGLIGNDIIQCVETVVEGEPASQSCPLAPCSCYVSKPLHTGTYTYHNNNDGNNN